MSSTPALTPAQENALVVAMLATGLSRDVAESVLTKAAVAMTGHPPRSGNVSVRQQAAVVEAGATMIGYRADRIG